MTRKRLLTGLALAGTFLVGTQLASFAQVGPPPLSLLNMAKFYSGLPQQDSALRTLQAQIDSNNPALLEADSIASNIWRNPDALIGHIDFIDQIPLAARTGSEPVSLAMSIASPGAGRPLSIEVMTIEGGTESPSRVMVTMDRSGFLDDSIAADRFRFDMTVQDGQWTIQRAGRQIRCLRGRGSQDFSDQLCS